MNRSSYIVSIGSALTLLFGASATEANAKHHSTKKAAPTISDLGPCVKGHILDLSRGAAQVAYGGAKKKRPAYPCNR